MHRLTRRLVAAGAAMTLAALGTTAAAQAHTVGEPGDPTMLVHLNDSEAGGSYHQTFERAYAGETADGTPVYIYVPEGGIGGAEGVTSLDPSFDHNPNDAFTPCADGSVDDYLITQAQIDALGDELANHIVPVDEAHFGDIGLADPNDPDSDALVMLVYNVQDESYYDCSVDTYTAGYFAPEYINEAGMNVIVVDAYDWVNRIGEDVDNPQLYEGVIAHELEHLLMNYSDPGEVSWVDEGLADMAIFLNCYDIGGSHLTYHQVFHRETSLTRWGGGLENYGASLTYFLYLWEQAGGNGDGTFNADCQYDGAGGDLLLKLIFQNQADGMAGVQAAIDAYNAMPGTTDLRSAEELFKDWAIAVKLDDESSDIWNFINIDFGDPAFTSWSVDIANDLFWKNRGQYFGRVPEGRWANSPKVPAQSALPFGVSYETFRNLGRNVTLDFEGEPTGRVAPHSEPNHWWGGAESQNENYLNVDTPVTAGDVVDFWTWYFIEEGWDYGYVEALVNGVWTTVPLYEYGTTTVVTTNTDPHDNNAGNGLTGTSGGAYFVDDPEYVHLQTGPLPAGTTDVRFRYSTDAAYLDTGFFVDDVMVDGAAATLSSEPGHWILTTGIQNNNWVVQILSPCDLTPGTTSEGELVDDAGNYVYRFEGNSIHESGFNTTCLDNKEQITVIISNLTTGDIQVLDADYKLRVTGSNKKG